MPRRMLVFNPRFAEGRTIVKVEMRPFSDGRGRTLYDPVIHLDNGAKLGFQVDESEDQDYGVRILYFKKGR